MSNRGATGRGERATNQASTSEFRWGLAEMFGFMNVAFVQIIPRDCIYFRGCFGGGRSLDDLWFIRLVHTVRLLTVEGQTRTV
jgi:hypothetical protein